MISHAIRGGFTNLIRSLGLSITAIFIITVSLTSVAILAALWSSVGYTIRQFDNQAIIYVYLKTDAGKENIDTIKKELEVNNDIKEYRFVDKESAKNRINNNPNVASIYTQTNKSIDQNSANLDVYWEYFEIIPKNIDRYQVVEDFVRQDRYKNIIQDIRGTKDFIQSLQRIYYWIGVGGIGLLIIFGLISILIMINVLRIAIFSRKDEIEIMRLVGATNSYIRGPFIAEGLFYNLIASVFVVIIFIPILSFSLPKLKEYVIADVSTGNLLTNIYISLGVTIFIGLLVGATSSFVATQRYLKL